jgi:hypothetical protein
MASEDYYDLVQTIYIAYYGRPADIIGRDYWAGEQAELTEHALGRKLTLYDRSIDTHISNLRRKLAQAGASGIEIRSVRGTGYELLLVEPL